MTIKYQIASGEESSTATILFSDGEVVNVTSTHPSYKQIVTLLINGSEDEEEILNLTLPALSAGKELNRLSERVIYDSGTIYFDGDPIDAAIAKHIIKIIQEGGTDNSYGALVKFLEKLYQNPSEASRNSLYEFLVRNSFTITPDGDFLAYKGVRSDAKSIHSGYGIVDGIVFTHDRLLNKVGSTLEMPRLKVDNDTAIGCSTGLHAGTYRYAANFAQGMLLLVKINPRDVVSVPDDCNFQKIRTCRYVVLTQTELEYTETTYTYADNDWADDSMQDREFGDLDEEEIPSYDLLSEAAEESTAVNFSYTNKRWEKSEVKNFVPDELRIQKKDVLVTGINEEGEFRSYKLSRMENLEFSPDTDDGFDLGFPEESPVTDAEVKPEVILSPENEVFVSGDEWAARTFAALHDE